VQHGPCFKCTKRRIGCHSECEDYILYRKGMDERSETIRQNKKLDQIGFRYYKSINSKGETIWRKKRTSD